MSGACRWLRPLLSFPEVRTQGDCRRRSMSQLAEKVEQHQPKSAQIKDAAFKWDDPLDLEGELTEEERMVRDTARDYAQEKLFPRVLAANRDEKPDPAIFREMGALGLARFDDPAGIRRRRPQLRLLWADRARARTGQFGLPLGNVGAVVIGDAGDLCLWQRSAAAQISAENGHRRTARLLRSHRTRLRLRSGLDGDPRRESRRRLSAHRATRCGSPMRRSPTSP